MTIPSDAIIPYEDGVFVFIVTEDKVFRRNITIGETIADRIVITGGLNTGDQVVTKGTRLRDGMATVIQP